MEMMTRNAKNERRSELYCIRNEDEFFKKLPSIRLFFTLMMTTYVGCLLGGEDDLGMLWDATVWRLELDQLQIGSA